MQLGLLFGRQTIANPHHESDLSAVSCGLRRQRLIEQRHGVLLIDGRLLQKREERLRRIGEFTLRFLHARLQFDHLVLNRLPLSVGKTDGGLVGHDQIGRKEQVSEGVGMLGERGGWKEESANGKDPMKRAERH